MNENQSSNNEVKASVGRQASQSKPCFPTEDFFCSPPKSFVHSAKSFSPLIILVLGVIALAALTFSHAVESLKDGTIKNGEESSINILDRSYC